MYNMCLNIQWSDQSSSDLRYAGWLGTSQLPDILTSKFRTYKVPIRWPPADLQRFFLLHSIPFSVHDSMLIFQLSRTTVWRWSAQPWPSWPRSPGIQQHLGPEGGTGWLRCPKWHPGPGGRVLSVVDFWLQVSGKPTEETWKNIEKRSSYTLVLI